jgi:cyanophycinase-like exopeptidase
VTTSAGTAALGVMSPYSFGNFDDDDPEIDGRAFADARCVLRSSTDKQTDLLIPALGLVPGAIFDSHFSQMNRLQRLKAGIEEFPQYVGIGIDENTGVHIVHGDECRVYGANQVFVVKSDGTQTQALPFNSGESFTLSQFR